MTITLLNYIFLRGVFVFLILKLERHRKATHLTSGLYVFYIKIVIFEITYEFLVELDGYTLFGTLIGPEFRQALGNSRYNVVVNLFGQHIGESVFHHASNLPSFCAENYRLARPASQLNPEFVRYLYLHYY